MLWEDYIHVRLMHLYLVYNALLFVLVEIIIMTFIPPPDNSSSIETKEKEKKDNSSFLKIT